VPFRLWRNCLTASRASSPCTPHPALRATFPSRGRLETCRQPSRGQEGDIRSAGKFPARFGNGSEGAWSWVQLNPISPEPPPSPKKPFAPSRSHTGQSWEFPLSDASPAFCILFLEKVWPVPRRHEWKRATPQSALRAASSPLRRGAKEGWQHEEERTPHPLRGSSLRWHGSNL